MDHEVYLALVDAQQKLEFLHKALKELQDELLDKGLITNAVVEDNNPVPEKPAAQPMPRPPMRR